MINLRLTWFLESNNLLSNLETGLRAENYHRPNSLYRNPNQRSIHQKETSTCSPFWTGKSRWQNIAIWHTWRPRPMRQTPHLHKTLLRRLDSPVSWGCRIHRLLLFRRDKTPHNEYPGYDTKQSDGEVLGILELWGMRSTPHCHYCLVHSDPEW